ncbi:hypothetical protein ONZ45_g3904 [Pleurotus djamor]|nr:hypothetical protein ONZ45_g3904 [Pleurotus djamor]
MFRHLYILQPRALISPSFTIGFMLGLFLHGVLLNQVALFAPFHPDTPASHYVFTVYSLFSTFITSSGALLRGSLSSAQVLIPVDGLKFGPTLNTGDIISRVETARPSRVSTSGIPGVWLASGLITSIVVPRGLLINAVVSRIRSDHLPGDPFLWFIIPTFVWHASSAMADVLVSCGLAFTLIRRRTGLPSTDSLIRNIIRRTLSVEFTILKLIAAFDSGHRNGDTHNRLQRYATCLVRHLRGKVIPTLHVPDRIRIPNLITKKRKSGEPSYLLADFVLAKLYSNTFLVTMNARVRWRREQAEFQDERLALPEISAPRSPRLERDGTPYRQPDGSHHSTE